MIDATTLDLITFIENDFIQDEKNSEQDVTRVKKLIHKFVIRAE